MNDKLEALLQLSHEIGREDRQLALLGEGNTSAKVSPEQFAVKASGAHLGTLTADDITVCDSARVLSLLDRRQLGDEDMVAALMDARVAGQGRKPSIESLFHAWLLTLREVNFIGHCHPL